MNAAEAEAVDVCGKYDECRGSGGSGCLWKVTPC